MASPPPEDRGLRSQDGTAIRMRAWTADAPAGHLLLVHGLAEHLDRYTWTGAALCAAGWTVHAVELRGHGRSEGKRGHVDAWSDYVDDLRTVAETLPRVDVLLAHSMGGLVALDALRCEAVAPDRLVLTSPLLDVALPVPRWKSALSGVLSRWMPRLSMPTGLDARWICTDAQVVEAYRADPLVFGTVTPRWFTEMIAAAVRVHAAAPAMRTPLQLHVAEEERIVSREAELRLFEAWGGPKQRVDWPGLRHEVLNEPARDRVLASILDWLRFPPG